MKILYIAFSFFLFSLIACTKSTLDKKPLDVITDESVWNDKSLVDIYLTQAYAQMSILTNETPILNNPSSGTWDPSNDDWNGPFIINEVSDEATSNWIKGQAQAAKLGGITVAGGILEWWESAYKTIRFLNEFLEKLPASSLDDPYKKSRMAEARFLRAYNYFSMVKRYGGVPLIVKTQSTTDPEEELFKSRNKEQEIYDFIIAEIDAIVNDLPERAATELGRPSKYAALALKSRAALYAGSISQFGKVQLNGVVGIADAYQKYYQYAYDASKQIMESGQYALYNKEDDKVLNFKNIFLKKNNDEVIWMKQHDYVLRSTSGGNGWVWDFFQTPKPHAWNAGNQNAPYLEMVEEFEHIDGSSGKLDRVALQSKLWTMEELWQNKDPRFFATIYAQGTPWKGSFVDFHNGLIIPDGTIITSESYNNVAAVGTQSVDNSLGSGFGVMKYLEETKDDMGERATSGTDWILFRYAEIMLNYAEAAFELGKLSDALNAINQLRARAGIAALPAITRELIRHERKVELAFEGHRYWDLRRWRIALNELVINRSGIRYILDYNTRKYKIEVLDKYDGSNADPVFYERNYYLPITTTRIANNKNLVENPGYQ